MKDKKSHGKLLYSIKRIETFKADKEVCRKKAV